MNLTHSANTLPLGVGMALDANCINRPGLAPVLRHHITSCTSNALRLIIIRVRNIHHKRGTNILMRRHRPTSCALTLDRCPPPLRLPATRREARHDNPIQCNRLIILRRPIVILVMERNPRPRVRRNQLPHLLRPLQCTRNDTPLATCLWAPDATVAHGDGEALDQVAVGGAHAGPQSQVAPLRCVGCWEDECGGRFADERVGGDGPGGKRVRKLVAIAVLAAGEGCGRSES